MNMGRILVRMKWSGQEVPRCARSWAWEELTKSRTGGVSVKLPIQRWLAGDEAADVGHDLEGDGGAVWIARFGDDGVAEDLVVGVRRRDAAMNRPS